MKEKVSNLDNKYEVRNKKEEKTVKLKFTPKIYKNLAMREKYIFEPPKLNNKDKKDGKCNVLWINDKGK